MINQKNNFLYQETVLAISLYITIITKNTLLISSEIKTIKKLLEDVTFSPNLALAEKFIFNNSLPLKE